MRQIAFLRFHRGSACGVTYKTRPANRILKLYPVRILFPYFLGSQLQIIISFTKIYSDPLWQRAIPQIQVQGDVRHKTLWEANNLDLEDIELGQTLSKLLTLRRNGKPEHPSYINCLLRLESVEHDKLIKNKDGRFILGDRLTHCVIPILNIEIA